MRRWAIEQGSLEQERIDVVSLAISPVHALTRAMVREAMDVTVYGQVDGRRQKLSDRPVRNLQGQVVFINLPELDAYEVNIEASAAGFFNVASRRLVVREAGEDVTLHHPITLHPLPHPPFPEGATTLGGVVIGAGSGDPIAGATITVRLRGPLMGPWDVRSMTDALGRFAVSARIPIQPGDDGRPDAVALTLTVAVRGGPARDLDVTLIPGGYYAFKERIALPSSAEPPELVQLPA